MKQNLFDNSKTMNYSFVLLKELTKKHKQTDM